MSAPEDKSESASRGMADPRNAPAPPSPQDYWRSHVDAVLASPVPLSEEVA